MELDLDKPLQPKVITKGYLLSLQCLDLQSICFNCGHYGHKEAGCLKKKVPIKEV